MNANIQFSIFFRFIDMKYVVFGVFLILLSCAKNNAERNPYLYETRFPGNPVIPQVKRVLVFYGAIVPIDELRKA